MLYGAKNTKENRLNSRQAQFNSLVNAGYIQETYKGVDFFSKDEGKYFTLKAYWGTGANHIEYINYRTAERRAEVIQNYKNNWDRNQTYKAEQKEKNKGKSSSHAGAAAAIKAELTSLYPGIKFSCTSDSFSMGDSVSVKWTDGPTDSEVNGIINKYQYGTFNGMEDIYENTNDREDIPQAKYVSGHRQQSENIEKCLPQLVELLNGYEPTSYRDEPIQILYRIFYQTSFPANYENLSIVKTDCTGGQMEDFYTFHFLNQNQQEVKTESTPVEVTAGEINIIDYSEKAFAVTGTAEDLKAIQSKMYELGGKWNKNLKCGPGYIFSKKKLDEVTAALSEDNSQTEETTPDTAEYKEQLKSIEQAKAGIKDEVQKMIQFFEETDIKNNGFVSEGTKQAASVQNVPLIYVERPEHYGNLKDIATAAQTGKVISLFNLYQLVNQ